MKLGIIFSLEVCYTNESTQFVNDHVFLEANF